MPFTPYHFGPSGFLGLVLGKWIDVPVFVLVNVIIDVEVLFAEGWPQHRHWHWHTLLIGAAVGAACGIAAYPMRHLFKEIMQGFRIRYETSFWKMVISGAVGACLHVVIDALYHYDVQPFWPKRSNPFWRLLSEGQVKVVCVAFFIAAVVAYVFVTRSFVKSKKCKTNTNMKKKEQVK